MLAALIATAWMSGYAADAACGNCHAEVAKTYREVGMARALTRPRAAVLIEDFDAPPFFHERSRQYFEMRRRGEELVFRRWQLASDGAPIHLFEQKVDWILGSGNHARTYLYATPGGELYQLPIAWYSQTREWRMAPGYDRPDHEGVLRRVRYECLFCHNAYAAAREEPLSYWRSQTFPAQLPEGIGCQRCHGPGAKHVELASAHADRLEIRRSIVNPARIGTKLRNDLCYGCHMQPTVIISGMRRFDRDMQSFRPGQPLEEYLHRLDIDEEALPRGERFEINHHPYRLEQSRCFTESAGELSCLSCHDPHRKVRDAAHFRKACLACHAKPHRIAEDCASCHMPKRRPQDVVHVVMTDHRIGIYGDRGTLLAPREEREPSITRIDSPDPLVAAAALVRATSGASAGAVRALARLVAERKPEEIEPYLDLASGLLRQRQWKELEAAADRILEKNPKQELALEWRAIARAAQSRDTSEAARVLASLSRPEAAYNAGVLLAQSGKVREAMALYERALADRPNLAAAWFRLGEARRDCGDRLGAVDAFRRALEIEPGHARARAAIVEALEAMGNAEEAKRYAR
ncbi:MAG TPA: tetratricopeptide repeat protein [Thermoanaerobaculia bacterium]|nr:tetratricopeptide repeat protein [Thermoanaerobaculia bacterium]